MSYQAMGVWPFDSTPTAKPADQSYTCYSDELNQKIVEDCQTNQGGLCTPEQIAHLLSLDYCAGTCERSSDKTMLWALGLGVLAIGLVVMRRPK